MPEDVSHRLSPSELELFNATVWRGAGCSKCNESGYHGRIGFFELVVVNPALRRAMSENVPIRCWSQWDWEIARITSRASCLAVSSRGCR